MESLRQKIIELKQQRNAVILAHNYQLGEVQDIADFVGDSLELSIRAKNTDADVIVFCGVHFMAETAHILSPGKTVLFPSLEAGCPMADMITAEELASLKKKHPDATVICYVNTSAGVKAECHACCTSSNASKVVNSIPENQEILFVPDKNLGNYINMVTGRKMILYPGFCPTHARILPHHIRMKRKQYPSAKVIVHPECRMEVIELADEVLSTGGMCRYANQTDAETIILGTELGLIHRLQKENPGKLFVASTEQAVCPNMKMINLEKVLWALEHMQHSIHVPENIQRKALAAVKRMTEITG